MCESFNHVFRKISETDFCACWPSGLTLHRQKRYMFRCVVIGLLCSTCLAREPPRGTKEHAPWVSCFSESGEHWQGAKTVRTPMLTSSDGKLRAYARIRAKAVGPLECGNTVRLMVSTPNSVGFRQVFMQRPSTLVGTATSLGPIGWSPNERWLLVEIADFFYASDAGGIGVLLYDRKNDKILLRISVALSKRT
jgi:hypothetical protein